jgi:serine/threonine protein kinase
MGLHPNIVRYVGELGHLRPCEVVEYVPGDSLKTLINRRHRVVMEQPWAALRQSAAALAHVHECGYLHLDLKPENFLVKFIEGRFIVKLTDFDFCCPLATRQVPRRFGGSLLYEPPEFLTRKEVSPQTDIFAFGAMAYQVLTFHLPYLSSSQELLKQREVQFAANNRIGETGRQWLRRCLQVEASRRFDSAEAMLEALDRVIAADGEPRFGRDR